MEAKNMLKIFLKRPSDKLLKWATIVAFIVFIIMTVVFQIFPVNTNSTPYGILNFELAFSSQTIKEIFTVWNTNPIIFQEQTIGVYLDYFSYIPAYFLTLDGIILFFTRKFSGKFQKIGLIMLIIPFIAAICDIFENVGLLYMLGDRIAYIAGTGMNLVPLITSSFSVIKFLFLLIGIIFGLFEILYWVVKNKVKKT